MPPNKTNALAFYDAPLKEPLIYRPANPHFYPPALLNRLKAFFRRCSTITSKKKYRFGWDHEMGKY